MNIAYLDYSLEVECPECEYTVDLTCDDEGHLSNLIFNNAWHMIAGHKVTCSQCGHEFELDKVEH